MSEIRLGAVEMQFAEIIRANAPLSSGTLVTLRAMIDSIGQEPSGRR